MNRRDLITGMTVATATLALSPGANAMAGEPKPSSAPPSPAPPTGFRATGASLGGGSGWVILAYNFQTGQPHTYWSGHHTQAVAFGQPLLVMDMYEHSYQMDYGAAAARYIDAFFQNIHWQEVNARLECAQKAAAALRG